MVEKTDIARVRLWDDDIGAVYWDRSREIGFFEFEPSYLKKEINLSPYLLTSGYQGILSYPELDRNTYKGLPGFLADTLPDDFGNAVIDAWLSRMGRSSQSFSPVERLCYTGTRGMGALEFHPAIARNIGPVNSIEIGELVQLASRVLNDRESSSSDGSNLAELISVGTSAGGQRPKALLAIHPRTGRIVSGQVKTPKEYENWLMKFDGVRTGHDRSTLSTGVVTDPQGFGKIEFAYYKMALSCGIKMMESKLYEEHGRSHFMTRRFDRSDSGEKIHMLSLCGMAHFDYRKAGYYSYEQLFQVMRELRLPYSQAVSMYRRMVYNIIARNQDDHTKNIVFTMNKNGVWALSPAFDLTFSYNPAGEWTNRHQMSLNGKRDGFIRADLVEFGKSISISRPLDIIEQVVDSVSRFGEFAEDAGVDKNKVKSIMKYHRLFSRNIIT